MRIAALLLVLCMPALAAGAVPVPEVGLEEARIPHPPILIDGDDGFLLPGSGVVGGRGLPDDPYRIAGWAVAATGDVAIELRNTTRHVVLERLLVVPRPQDDELCFFNGICSTTVELDGARNVTLRDSRIIGAARSLHIIDSEDVRVGRVAILPPATDSAFWTGIALARVARVELAALEIAPAPFGIVGTDASDLALHDTTLRGGSWALTLQGEIERPRIERIDIEESKVDLRFARLHDIVLRDSVFHDVFFASGWGITSGLVCGNQFLGSNFRAFAPEGLVVSDNLFHGGFGLTLGALGYDGGATVVVERNVLIDTRRWGFALSGVGFVARDNVIEVAETEVYGAGNDLRGNWWGHPSGPSGAGPGEGALLTLHGAASYEPWLRERPDLPLTCP